MRKDRILALAGHLRESESGFNMATWAVKSSRSECGSVACIAGHAIKIFDPQEFDHLINMVIPSLEPLGHAGRLLGLDRAQSRELFTPDFVTMGGGTVTAEQAAVILENLAETGVVQWNLVRVTSGCSLAGMEF